MSYQFWIQTPGDGPEGTANGCRYATAEEAQRAGDELLCRWFTKVLSQGVREVDGDVNYEFPEGLVRPRPLAREGEFEHGATKPL